MARDRSSLLAPLAPHLSAPGPPHRPRRSGFRRQAPTGRVDRRHLRRVLDRINVIQVDSVNVLVRSQELPLFARLGPHPRTMLADAIDDGELWEYWAHVAAIVPSSHHRLFRWRMASDDEWKASTGERARSRSSSRPSGSGSATVGRSPPPTSSSASARRAMVELGRRQDRARAPVPPRRGRRRAPPARLRPRVRPHRADDPGRACSTHRRRPRTRRARSSSPSPPAAWAWRRSRTWPTTTASGGRSLQAARRRARRGGRAATCRRRGLDESRHTSTATPAARGGRRPCPAQPVRLGGVAPRPQRTPLRLPLPHRDLHAPAEAHLRLLRAAVPARRPPRRARRPQGRPRRRSAPGPGRLHRAGRRRGGGHRTADRGAAADGGVARARHRRQHQPRRAGRVGQAGVPAVASDRSS